MKTMNDLTLKYDPRQANPNMINRFIRIFIYILVGFAAAFLYRYLKGNHMNKTGKTIII